MNWRGRGRIVFLWSKSWFVSFTKVQEFGDNVAELRLMDLEFYAIQAKEEIISCAVLYSCLNRWVYWL